jgi:mono/diheme cytochrome c family protein
MRIIHKLLLSTLLVSGSLLAEDAKPVAPKTDTSKTVEVDPQHAEKMQAGLDLFKTGVRSVFQKHCLECHGGDEVQSGFDLATRKGLIRGGSKGAAVIPGKPEESRLMALITHNEDPHMPEGGDKLPAADIAAIKQWISLGAPYDMPLVENPRDPDSWTNNEVPAKSRDYWSFRPLAATSPPSVKNSAWVKSPLDAFVLSKLEEKGLSPNPPVDKRRLIRRAYFDLIGLPPKAAEVEAFVKNEDPQAYEKLLDQLLSNEHYGERWGRYWLDVARFAESHGFEQDYDRPHAYHFRDFVIEALNQDMPFDQFVKWQLAGDEFAPENPLALKATGFLGAGVFPTQITANEVERTRYDALDDMAGTTGTAFLGLTIGCARCHDHKFDPIPQGDYYRFTSTFTTTVRGNLEVNMAPKEYEPALAAWTADHKKLTDAVEQFEKEKLPSLFTAWEANSADELKKQAWQLLDIAEMKSAGGATLTKLPDGSMLASGENPDFDTYTIVAKTNLSQPTAIKLEALAHPSMVKNGPGRAANGNIALTNFTVVAKWADGAEQSLKLQNAQATFEQNPSLLVKNAIDNDPKSAWALDPQFGKDHAAVFEIADMPNKSGECTLTFTLDFNNNHKHNIGRARLSLIAAPLPVSIAGNVIPQDVAELLKKSPNQRNPKELTKLHEWYRQRDAQWQQVNKPVQDHLAQKPKPKTITMMVCSEGITPIRHHTQGADFFNEFYYLKRGDCNQKQGLASPSFLQVLMNSPDKEKRWQVTPPANSKLSYRRTALANWLTDTEQGAGDLLARVFVNRLWQGHFGKGIVHTANDFGLQGKKPTHPELLEWLANDLIANQWKIKRLHKQIMLSNAYTQTSTSRDDGLKLDPQNELLWRFSPKRLEAEVIRDTVLAVSGQLDEKMYGPGTLDEASKRRSIYFTVKRSKLIPMMQLFDQPEPLVGVGNRPSTTVAPQALALMNSPHVRRDAQAFANQLTPAADKSWAEAIELGYVSAVGRTPDAEEISLAVAFLESQEKSYQASNKKNARALALADFCQILFELNEFVYVE